MTDLPPLSFTAPLGAYLNQAQALLADLHAGDEAAAWRFKWEHPRFRGAQVGEVRSATLDLEDSKLVTARSYAFESWEDLAAFVERAASDRGVARFETAVDAMVGGDRDMLEALLREDPALVGARSARRHRATLLHYVAANGVEGWRQRTPPNMVDIARLLLDAGADPNALANMYDTPCGTLGLLVSSSPPADAGLQPALAELLVDRGAALEPSGSSSSSAVFTALVFGFLDTARALAARDGRVHDVAVAAGLGLLGETARLLPSADPERLRAALVLACMHGQLRVAELLLDAGVDPSQYNPPGMHDHSTPLHQAVWANREPIVRLLVERGAPMDVRDRVYDATPLDWAVYGERGEIADFLRARGGQTRTAAS
ncbi:MAG TPA: ankyrin repeat domain-containing protein [Gemmatimonadaceae bacterium]|nr:ankyrin repeat domain-containing protein [Gemmatimonadaceae bacterium]